jgi:uncharacterized protein YfaS (alpha-2-macroglobulin family)
MCGIPLAVNARLEDQQQRATAAQAQKEGNFKDALEIYKRLIMEALPDGQTHTDLRNAVICLNKLGRINEFDKLAEDTIQRHATDWRVLSEASRQYRSVNHSGAIVAGEFTRGPNRSRNAKYTTSIDRDRVRGIQLLLQAIELAGPKPGAPQKSSNKELARLYRELASSIRQSQSGTTLAALTDFETLPDYSAGQRFRRFGYVSSQGAPVNEDGSPLLHAEPRNWGEAKSDGERWRFATMQMAELDPQLAATRDFEYAQFLQSQFGVQTLGGMFSQNNSKSKDGPWNVSTLTEDETIARLATGPKRFKLTAESNYIKLLARVSEGQSQFASIAMSQLASIFSNRQQYPRAAAILRTSLQKFGEQASIREQLDQIVGNWGRFENARVHAAGKGATVDFRSRNASEVKLTAKRIRTEKLLTDVKAYFQSRPKQLDSRKFNLNNIGYRLIRENETQYLGEQVAAWNLELEPPADHFDQVTTITTPLQKAGAYLLTATLPDGNTSRIVLWLTDAAIVRKQLDSGTMFYVASAMTGKPIANAELDFFGYKQVRIDRRQFKVELKQSRLRTNADGIATAQKRVVPDDYQWLISAKTPGGGLATLGFDRVWYGRSRTFTYNQNKVYLVTDRPVYRPGQTVKYKFWVRNPRFDGPGKSFVNSSFELKLRDGRSQEIVKQKITTDEFGNYAAEFKLKDDATLGNYYLSLNGNRVSGGGRFRVEEYKKPEYEVTVEAPKRPVALGEKAMVTVQARYYFGSPVTNAKVHYKVSRTSMNQRWYPRGRWDWLYGRGYGWPVVNRPWYPGNEFWCCVGPYPWWLGQRNDPPEIVLDREVQIGEDGTVQFEIDTAVAKAIHSDKDHRYTITAEVVDLSRRTIVGTGSVIVARKPFDVVVWTNRGHYKSGDTIDVNLRAGSLDGTKTSGSAKVRLLQIAYDKDGQPSESEVATANVPLNESGTATHKFKAARTGQYRVSVVVTDDQERQVEGGKLLVVRGGDADGSEFRFNDLELITDKREYSNGDTAELLINTDRLNSHVLLFVRAENGLYPQPKLVRVQGKSTVENIQIGKADMPNMFVEALTISNGRVHSEIREIHVPPEQRLANVEVQSTKADYLPGAKAEVQLKLTGPDGRPVQTPTVVTVYDKSVEYISGGSAIPDVREFFWKIRRRHYQQTRSNLQRITSNLLKRREKTLRTIGVFGNQIQPNIALSDSKRLLSFGVTANSRQMRAPVAESAMVADAMGAGPSQPAAVMAAATIRKQFADTAFWSANVQPDANGIATVRFDLPDDLTTWKVRTWSIDKEAQVGSAETEFVTRKNLIVRMQAPRFFTERDEVMLSANVHNYLNNAKTVRVELELEGSQLASTGSLTQTVDVPADGEVRVDWMVKVNKPGDAIVRMKALTDVESDAVERTFPVLVHGMLKTESWTGSIPINGNTASIDVTVPADRRPDQTELVVRYSPTLAGAMVDALPYLIDGPHSTTDATLYRFVPAAVVQRVLQRTGVNLDEVRTKRANLNAQQLGDAVERAKQWKRYKRNPIFNNEEMAAIVQENLDAVVQMQLSDGGWGWFSGWGERSTAHMTATIVHGLQIAKQNDLVIPNGVIERGIAWLKRHEKSEIQRLDNWPTKVKPRKQYASNLDALVFMVLTDDSASDPRMRAYLYRDRTKLSVAANAIFGMSLHKLGAGEPRQQLNMVLQNLSQFLETDEENQTAWLKLPRAGWWYWWGNDIEAQAWYLKLLAQTDPKGQRAPAVARYILNNRRNATWWGSVRDTALSVEALADFAIASGEFQPNLAFEILVDGKVRKNVTINRDNLFSYDDRLTLSGDALTSGRHTIELRKTGTGPLYFSAYLTNFTKEDSIAATGLEIKVQREFYRLIKVETKDTVAGSRGQAIKQRGEKYRRERLVNFAEVKSGDLIEVELLMSSKNDYDYIVLEDPKPAGFEAVDQTSGYTGNGLGAYMEVRDNRIALYARNIARGESSVSYRVRAEVPGKFSAMPTRVFGMYAPELKANSDESKFVVKDME